MRLIRRVDATPASDQKLLDSIREVCRNPFLTYKGSRQTSALASPQRFGSEGLSVTTDARHAASFDLNSAAFLAAGDRFDHSIRRSTLAGVTCRRTSCWCSRAPPQWDSCKCPRAQNPTLACLTFRNRAIGTPLAWPEAAKVAGHVRQWGIEVSRTQSSCDQCSLLAAIACDME